MQIVQELCRRPGLNKCGFEMPTIYIPNPQKVRALAMSSSPCDDRCKVAAESHVAPPIGDFAILDTLEAAALRRKILAQKVLSHGERTVKWCAMMKQCVFSDAGVATAP